MKKNRPELIKLDELLLFRDTCNMSTLQVEIERYAEHNRLSVSNVNDKVAAFITNGFEIDECIKILKSNEVI